MDFFKPEFALDEICKSGTIPLTRVFSDEYKAYLHTLINPVFNQSEYELVAIKKTELKPQEK